MPGGVRRAGAGRPAARPETRVFPTINGGWPAGSAAPSANPAPERPRTHRGTNREDPKTAVDEVTRPGSAFTHRLPARRVDEFLDRVGLTAVARKRLGGFSLGDLTGRPTSYHEESVEEAYASRAPYGAPDWQVDAWVSTYTAIAAGEVAAVSDAVERLTGEPAITLAECLRGPGGACPRCHRGLRTASEGADLASRQGDPAGARGAPSRAGDSCGRFQRPTVGHRNGGIATVASQTGDIPSVGTPRA